MSLEKPKQGTRAHVNVTKGLGIAERQMRSGIKWDKLHWVTVKGDSSEDEPWIDSISDQRVPLKLPPQYAQPDGEAETASRKDFSLQSTHLPYEGPSSHDSKWTRQMYQ